MLRLVLQRLSQPSSSSSNVLLQAVQQPGSCCNSVLAGLWSGTAPLGAIQQLHSVAAVPSWTQQHTSILQQQPQQRTFTSSLPSMIYPRRQRQEQQEQQQPQQQQGQSHKHKHKHKKQQVMPRRSIFWNGLESDIPSRKPAIKSPARHQWHYCNPAYDPMEPLPEQYLPPYASDRAHSKNYRSIFYANMPKHHRNRYRRMWAKNMTIADQRWRQAWERKLAERRKAIAKVERIADRIKRQRSWEAWQANKAAAAAPKKPQRQRPQKKKREQPQQQQQRQQPAELEAGSGEQAGAAMAAAPEVK